MLVISFVSTAQNKPQSIGFTENKGQIVDQKGKVNSAVKYLLNTPGLNVQLRKNGFSYDVYETKKHTLTENQKAKQSHSFDLNRDDKNTPDYSLEYIYHRIDIDFVNSNSKVTLVAEEKSADYDNYYNVPNKPEGVLIVHKFKQITYKNIYPNIDVVFFIPKDTVKPVEYNFIVHPKGKITDIQLKFSGLKTNLVDNKIQMQVRFGEMEETLPLSWIEEGRAKKEIAVGYKKIKNNVYGFESDSEVSGKTIIIDPVPTRLWGTFYGNQTGSSTVIRELNVVTDKIGNSYLMGNTSVSNSSYATTGAHQTSLFPSIYLTINGIIAKFSPNGNRLWGTYYGGQNDNIITDIKIDSENNIVITGLTYAESNISTIGAYKQNLSGQDAFLAKFNNSGVRLWGTYFGGENSESATALDLDESNNIYIVGTTTSSTGIAKNSNFQTELIIGTSETDSFLAKFNTSGNLIWSTYVSGEGRDELKAIVVKDNYLVTAGYTTSYNNMGTPGVFQKDHNPEYPDDGIIYKFSVDGQRIWTTYYGGDKGDQIYCVEIDDENNIYIGGETSSENKISTPNSFEISNPNLYKGFFGKLNSSGERIWGSYLGEANVYSLIFRNNSIYIGATNNQSFNTKLTNSCSYKSNEVFQGYIGKFSKQGDFIWGTFVGGQSIFNTTKITIDNKNAIYVAGISSLNNGMTDSNSYQANLLGHSNYYLLKFSEDSITNPEISSNSPICIGKILELKASGGTNYSWTGPNGFTSTQQNPIISNATSGNSGEYNCAITGASSCDETKKIEVVVGDLVAPVPNNATLPTINSDCTTIISTIPTATDACAGAINATTLSPLSYTLPGTYTIVWNYDDGNGNSVNQNQTVIVSNQPLPITTSPQAFCLEENATINNIIITGQNIKWYDAPTVGNLIPTTTILQNGKTYYASQNVNGCESLRIPIVVNIQNTTAPTGSATQSLCATQNAALNEIKVSGTDLKWYATTTSTTALLVSTLLVDGTKYFATQTINSCESLDRFEVTVSLISTLNANNYAEMLCDDLNDGSENINLSDYNSKLIASTADVIFSYYSSDLGAENENTSEKLNNNYKLSLGLKTIYVRIDSNNGCHQIVTLTLELVSKPILTINDIVPICENKPITVSAGFGADSYLWSTGATSQSTVISVAGDYSVTVTKNNGAIACSSTKNFSVKNSQTATIKNIEIKDWTSNDNQIIVYTNETGDFEYSINGTNFQDSNQFTNLPSGDYTITVRDKYGCGTSTEEVYLLMFPKFFTPNGDEYNPTWSIQNSEKENLITKIYDRYGKVIIILQPNQSWDGTLNGKNLPSTDYWFTVTRANGKEYKGHFSLKR